jgi:hypothetical protein
MSNKIPPGMAVSAGLGSAIDFFHAAPIRLVHVGWAAL